MSYRLQREDASPTCAMRRIAREQIERAIQSIDRHASEPDEAVHDVRKRCKKVRGLIRLVRPAFARYKDENRALRDIARGLAPWRDAIVLVEVYDAVTAAFEDQIDRRALASIRRRLTLDRQALHDQRSPAQALERCRSELGDALGRIAHWQLDADGFDALGGGLHKTCARAFKAMRKAQAQASPERLHEWRKRCKYHWYHARLLRPLWPGPMKAYADAVHALSDDLGDHHDLSVFLDALTREPKRFGAMRDVEAMTGLARRRQALLAASAFRRGRRIFAGSPDALVERWGRRHAAWRAEMPLHEQAMQA